VHFFICRVFARSQYLHTASGQITRHLARFIAVLKTLKINLQEHFKCINLTVGALFICRVFAHSQYLYTASGLVVIAVLKVLACFKYFVEKLKIKWYYKHIITFARYGNE